MRGFALLILVLSAALLCLAAPAATNAVPNAASVAAVTNAPAAKLSRAQCEALTKSGTRCKRNAAPGEKLCRQHLKIDKHKPHSLSPKGQSLLMD